MASEAQSNIWVDANGFTRLTTYNTDVATLAINVQMALLSNAAIQRYWHGPNVITGAAAGIGVYQSVQDAAVLSFETASGSILKLVLPAPKLAVFKADQQTVDPVAIAGLIAAALADMTDLAGNPVVTYIGGFYQRSGKVLVGG